MAVMAGSHGSPFDRFRGVAVASGNGGSQGEAEGRRGRSVLAANRLKEYRVRYGLTQPALVAAVRRRAQLRGDAVVPGLDQTAVSKHENGHKRPSPHYQALYCEVFGATPAALGFCLALPGGAPS